MRFFVFILFAVSGLASLPLCADEAPPEQRIISIGGSVTEIIYALGQEQRLVARDTTSVYPEAVQALPDVGYMRSLSPEGVLSVEPDLIIAEAGSGPKETVDVLREASVKFIEIPDGFDRGAIKTKILTVADALGVKDTGAKLADNVDAQLADVQREIAAHRDEAKRVLFVLSTTNNRIMAAGTNTAADSIIRMAGGINAISEFEGYKPVTEEAITAAAPDAILMMARSSATGDNHSKTADELFSLPAIATTPAAQSRHLVQINGLLLLGFGPRTAKAIKVLNNALYGEKP